MKREVPTNTKEVLMNQFEGCLEDFWGEKVTRSEIKKAWQEFMSCCRESGEVVPRSFDKLTKEEREHFYQLAGV